MDFIRGCRVLSWTESNTHTVRIVTGHLHGGVEVVKGGVRYTVVAKALIIGQGVYSCYSAVPRLQILSSDSKNIHISLKIDHFRCSQQLKQNRRPVGVTHMDFSLGHWTWSLPMSRELYALKSWAAAFHAIYALLMYWTHLQLMHFTVLNTFWLRQPYSGLNSLGFSDHTERK